MDHEKKLCGLLQADPWRRKVLHALQVAEIDDAWIAAGFIRNMVWDHLSDISPCPPNDDVDVLVFNADDLSWGYEEALEKNLTNIAPDIPWSVRNQARMHERNGDEAYSNIQHAMTYWLETATGVAVRLDAAGEAQFISAYGYEDLFDLILRPTNAGFCKIEELEERAQTKGWLTRWPSLIFKKTAS